MGMMQFGVCICDLKFHSANKYLIVWMILYGSCSKRKLTGTIKRFGDDDCNFFPRFYLFIVIFCFNNVVKLTIGHSSETISPFFLALFRTDNRAYSLFLEMWPQRA